MCYGVRNEFRAIEKTVLSGLELQKLSDDHCELLIRRIFVYTIHVQRDL